MIIHIAALLCFQLLGEVVSRALSLPLPGPVLGMILLLATLVAFPKFADEIRGTAQGLLAHLSLLFVPAGVGVVGHLDKLGNDGVAVLVAIVASTILAMVAAVYTFLGVNRLLGHADG